MTQVEVVGPGPGGPCALEDFRDDARALTDEAFAARHGRAFFLHHGALGDLRPARRGQPTVLVDGEPPAAGAVRLDFLVFPIRTSSKTNSPGFVSIGRTENNDIVINDVSVSKFHAFCRLNGDGSVVILDSGSSNGTFVNDIAVPRHGSGEPVHLSTGDTVRLGTVRLSFLPHAAFRNMVVQLGG
ncbi:MAG: FHA domain-containing protein [Deltaproteobacteria bacterium]|nr:FHA domain-containing protein [Deltaproteobacteria bacterium]